MLFPFRLDSWNCKAVTILEFPEALSVVSRPPKEMSRRRGWEPAYWDGDFWLGCGFEQGGPYIVEVGPELVKPDTERTRHWAHYPVWTYELALPMSSFLVEAGRA